MGGTGLLHGCLRFVSWPCADTTAAGIGHSDVTLPQCWRETKQVMNEALVLQTSLRAKAMSPVTVFAVYTANYRDSFSGASLCTLRSLIPSAPSRALHLTNNLGSHKAATGKASSSSSCSAVLSRTCAARTALERCTQDALGTDGGGGGARGSALIPVLKGFCNAALVGLATAMGHPR